MKSIMLIIPSLLEGGTENYVLRLLKYDSKNNYTVLSLSNKKGGLYDEYIKTGADIRILSIGYFSYLGALRLHKLIREKKVETIVSFNGNFAALSILVAFITGVKTRIVFYRRSEDAFKSNLFKSAYNKFAKTIVSLFATKILSNSRTAFNVFFQSKWKTSQKFKVINNGIDIDQFTEDFNKEEIRMELGINKGDFVIGHIGRYSPVKNHTLLFESLKKLNENDSKYVLLLSGRETDSTEVNVLLEKFNISNTVIGLGVRKDIYSILKAIDLFVFPSFSEGQPNALIEAMVAGVPFIASDIESIRESIPKDSDKLLFNPYDIDAAVSLINQIRNNKLELDTEKTKEWAINKYNHIDRFNEFLIEL